MPPKSKKIRISTVVDTVQLVCGFSHCEDSLTGMDEYVNHTEKHITIMKSQLQEIMASSSLVDVDKTKCECPWRGCNKVLEHEKDWFACERHIYFHSFHTYLKALGDIELTNRAIINTCSHSQEHCDSVPELLDRFHCKWTACQYVNDNAWKFYRHVDSHTILSSVDDQWECSWDRCSFTARNRNKLLNHLHSHTQEKSFACSSCGSLLSNSTKFSDHHTRQSIGEHNFQCSHCLKRFATERILRDHLRKHVNLYNCMFCEMTCPNPSSLRVHILYRHSEERPYACPHCSARFKRECDQRKHMDTHETENTTFACGAENCTFTAQSMLTLQNHTRTEHTEHLLFECHICSQQFTKSAKGLTKHLRKMHNVTLPSGHVRFRYVPHEDGVRRLVTVRYEGAANDQPDVSDGVSQPTQNATSRNELSLIEVWNIDDNESDGEEQLQTAAYAVNIDH